MEAAPITVVAADEAMQARFLKGHRRGNILSVFTYIDREYIDADVKKKGLLRLVFDSCDDKVEFLRRHKIEHQRHSFPVLGRIASGSQFIKAFRKNRIERSDIDRVLHFPRNFAIYYRQDQGDRLGYVSVNRRSERAGEVLHWLNLLVDAGEIEYVDYSDQSDRPMINMWDHGCVF